MQFRPSFRAGVASLILITTATACTSTKQHDAPASSAASSSTATTHGAATPVASPASAVASTPIRTIRTSDGTVGYRSVGRGPIIVLVMGFGGSQNNWTPSFVAELARAHRVITFDNAGIGQTSALGSPLTVTAMARQTAALLAALHTGPVDVLGWSMGGTIAQALAVLEPTLVSRLVLAATYPGNGTATAPTADTVRRLTASVTNPAAALPLLFPPSALTAQEEYLTGIFSWTAPDLVLPKAVAAQGAALTSWQHGTEAAGRRNSAIAAPTLVADAAADLLTPPANVHALAKVISGAQAVVYPAAGHAFLFQLQKQFLARVTAFLR